MKIQFAISILFLINIVYCQQHKSPSDDYFKQALANQLINSAANTSITCPTTTTQPTFSSLATAGVSSSCGRSGCHSGSSPQSGFDATNYQSALARVVPKNPSGSLLYQRATGNMSSYSSTQINTAIYCWIQGGALQ